MNPESQYCSDINSSQTDQYCDQYQRTFQIFLWNLKSKIQSVYGVQRSKDRYDTLKGDQNVERLPNVKKYYKVIVIKIIWYWLRIHQLNCPLLPPPTKKPHIFGNLIYDRIGTLGQWRIFSINGAEITVQYYEIMALKFSIRLCIKN